MSTPALLFGALAARSAHGVEKGEKLYAQMKLWPATWAKRAQQGAAWLPPLRICYEWRDIGN